ncbi:hypothetical protein [Epilithonimonas tenax]|uniref:hypothetical protein n=1 Tax=Epilithonimonas tenax TaxID=191577 RepID=UPI00373FDEC4
MPFVFYRFSGYGLFVGFCWLAYDAFQRRDPTGCESFCFDFHFVQSFFPIPFPHFLWLIVNMVIIIGMILNILFAEDNPYEDDKKKMTAKSSLYFLKTDFYFEARIYSNFHHIYRDL